MNSTPELKILTEFYIEDLTWVFVLLNLLNELRKRDKMRGLPNILSLFRNDFNKFNNTRAWMLDFIYHMALRLLWNLISAIKRYKFVIMYCNVVMDVIKFPKSGL